METAFTPVTSAAGGALIGLAAVLLMAFHGRILGATGIVNGLLGRFGSDDWQVRAALIAGMVLAPSVYFAVSGAWPAVSIPVDRTAILVGGVLVGFGASLGSGCTSGHGVCGIARLSPRSLTATATFMAAAFATVFVTRHLLGA